MFTSTTGAKSRLKEYSERLIIELNDKYEKDNFTELLYEAVVNEYSLFDYSSDIWDNFSTSLDSNEIFVMDIFFFEAHAQTCSVAI